MSLTLLIHICYCWIIKSVGVYINLIMIFCYTMIFSQKYTIFVDNPWYMISSKPYSFRFIDSPNYGQGHNLNYLLWLSSIMLSLYYIQPKQGFIWKTFYTILTNTRTYLLPNIQQLSFLPKIIYYAAIHM